jgi:hypothetical protein
MAPKRKRSGSSFHEPDEARIEKQVTKGELENVHQNDAESDGEELRDSKNISQLCEKCEEMTYDTMEYGPEELTSLTGFLHHSKLQLEEIAQRGCKSCVLLWAEASGPGDWGQEHAYGAVIRNASMTAINALGVPFVSQQPDQPDLVPVGRNKLDSLRFKRPNSNEQSFPDIEMAITANEGK